MALLAYEEPEKSPMFHLLSKDYRQQVADSLNRAILGLLPTQVHAFVERSLNYSSLLCFLVVSAHSNLPSYTAMERLIQQTTAVRQSLSEDNVKVACSSFIYIFLLNF